MPLSLDYLKDDFKFETLLDKSVEIENALFDRDNTLPDNIDFEFCIFGSGATFTIQANHMKSSCMITLVRNGAPSRNTDC